MIHGNVPPPGPSPLGPKKLKGSKDMVADHDEATDEHEKQHDVDEYFNNDYVMPPPERDVPCQKNLFCDMPPNDTEDQ